jgi:hypothetical protein
MRGTTVRTRVFTTDGGEIRRSVYGATWEAAHAEMTRLKADSIGGMRVLVTARRPSAST